MRPGEVLTLEMKMKTTDDSEAGKQAVSIAREKQYYLQQ
jgi:hypothetical protein